MKKLITGVVTAAALIGGLGAVGASAQAAPAPQLIRVDYDRYGGSDRDWRHDRWERHRWEERRRAERRWWLSHHRHDRYDRRW